MKQGHAPTERAPQQDRSRQSWERALHVGMELFEEHGWDGLTITEVCRRAKISAPSLYARVDGKAGLFLAVHERWLERIARTEDELITQFLRVDASPSEAAGGAAQVVMGVFERHAGALRALIDRSARDEELLERGALASQEFVRRLAQAIPADFTVGATAVRAVYAECLLRLMYGARFLMVEEESIEDFHQRVTGLARTIVAGPGPGRG